MVKNITKFVINIGGFTAAFSIFFLFFHPIAIRRAW